MMWGITCYEWEQLLEDPLEMIKLKDCSSFPFCCFVPVLEMFVEHFFFRMLIWSLYWILVVAQFNPLCTEVWFSDCQKFLVIKITDCSDKLLLSSKKISENNNICVLRFTTGWGSSSKKNLEIFLRYHVYH